MNYFYSRSTLVFVYISLSLTNLLEEKSSPAPCYQSAKSDTITRKTEDVRNAQGFDNLSANKVDIPVTPGNPKKYLTSSEEDEDEDGLREGHFLIKRLHIIDRERVFIRRWLQPKPPHGEEEPKRITSDVS